MDITISRYRKHELEAAIKDLESRGWVLIKEGEQTSYLNEFSYKAKGLHQIDKRSYNKFQGFVEGRLYKARLRKEDKDHSSSSK